MKKLFLFAVICMALCASSCTTISKTSKSVNVNSSICQYPTVADLDVNPQKVEKTYKWNWNPLSKEPSVNVVIGNIIAEILKEHDGDVLLEPQVIRTKVSFGERTVTVSGFPAKYKNFRKANESDLKAIDVVKDMQPNERTTYNNTGSIIGWIFK